MVVSAVLATATTSSLVLQSCTKHISEIEAQFQEVAEAVDVAAPTASRLPSLGGLTLPGHIIIS